MSTIARSVDIRITAEQAFEFMAEVSNLAQFHEGITDLRLLSEKSRGMGVTFACKVDVPRTGPLECEHEIIEFVDYISITVSATKGCKSVGTWHFSRMAGMIVKTRVTYTLSYQVPVPVIGCLIDLIFVRRIWMQRVEQTLYNLKNVLEKIPETP